MNKMLSPQSAQSFEALKQNNEHGADAAVGVVLNEILQALKLKRQ